MFVNNARKLVETFIAETRVKPRSILVASDVWLALQKQCGYDPTRHGTMPSMSFMGYTLRVEPQFKPGMIVASIQP